MEPIGEKLLWAITLAALGGIAWIAKTIIKPWNDASLLRAQAFVTLVDTLQQSMPAFAAETRLQTAELRTHSEKLDAIQGSTALSANAISQFPTHITTSMKDTALDVAATLRETASAVAASLERTAAEAATALEARADRMAGAVEARANEMNATSISKAFADGIAVGLARGRLQQEEGASK